MALTNNEERCSLYVHSKLFLATSVGLFVLQQAQTTTVRPGVAVSVLKNFLHFMGPLAEITEGRHQ